MNIIIWVLMATASGSSSSPIAVGTFPTEIDCYNFVGEMERRSKAKSEMRNLAGICVPARNFTGIKQ